MLDNNHAYLNDLFEFLDNSPTPFHACENSVQILMKNHYQQLSEADNWGQLKPGKYLLTRNDSSLIAFQISTEPLAQSGMNIIGAHTDSPCLKLKPNADINSGHYLQTGVEVYGGVLLNPWFDRDLSLAGTINYLNKAGQMQSALLDFKRAIALIPSLAIHLDREANEQRSINKQTDLPPILMLQDKENNTQIHQLLINQLQQQGHEAEKILAYDLSFYDTQKAQTVGINEDFFTSARLDNLLSCYVSLRALLEASENQNAMIVLNDHEEVGSASTSGAQGNFLVSVLKRLCQDEESYQRCASRSFFISSDNAHGIHPNYADKHDKSHAPVINQGPVIKINSNQRYASNSETVAALKILAQNGEIPVQQYVVRSDMGCGSTIGPLTATMTGIKTVDIGVPTWAMHSIRETAGTRDVNFLHQLLVEFFNQH